MTIRTAYDRKSTPGVSFEAPTMAQQHFKDECDVNLILKKFQVTGVLDHVRDGAPQFGDFSNVSDYLTAQNILIEAQDSFDSLPASLRKRFDNNPVAMLEFLQDDNNRKEAESLGLINKLECDDNSSISEPDIPGDVSLRSLSNDSVSTETDKQK